MTRCAGIAARRCSSQRQFNHCARNPAGNRSRARHRNAVTAATSLRLIAHERLADRRFEVIAGRAASVPRPRRPAATRRTSSGRARHRAIRLAPRSAQRASAPAHLRPRRFPAERQRSAPDAGRHQLAPAGRIDRRHHLLGCRALRQRSAASSASATRSKPQHLLRHRRQHVRVRPAASPAKAPLSNAPGSTPTTARVSSTPAPRGDPRRSSVCRPA